MLTIAGGVFLGLLAFSLIVGAICACGYAVLWFNGGV